MTGLTAWRAFDAGRRTVSARAVNCTVLTGTATPELELKFNPDASEKTGRKRLYLACHEGSTS